MILEDVMKQKKLSVKSLSTSEIQDLLKTWVFPCQKVCYCMVHQEVEKP